MAKGFAEQEGEHVVTYLLREQVDLHGHTLQYEFQYEWDTSEGHALLTSVTWNDISDPTRQRIVFTYEKRPERGGGGR